MSSFKFKIIAVINYRTSYTSYDLPLSTAICSAFRDLSINLKTLQTRTTEIPRNPGVKLKLQLYKLNDKES